MDIDRPPWDPDMALSSCIDRDFTMTSRWQGWLLAIGYSSPNLASPVPSPLTVLKLFCFSFCSHLYIVVAPVAGWPHGWWASGGGKRAPGYLLFAPVAWSWMGLFLPSRTVWQESRLASVGLWPARVIQPSSGLWAFLSASDPQQRRWAGLGMSYSSYSVCPEGRQGSVCPVPASSLQLRAGLCPH